ncbi:hypothetical protein W97_06813 [Coniosporium apollinis CBS 100218]|uniref:Beta-lactamase-related domain-containing protein n=1 Tax=Coniosporium apollinis (strain CBS 100218) TaxID=1168221 RepID=R7Z0F1_CONA1|nr:uncharacterized protein W97_06813 [Coniosporium apollinis CBS 100218]EON67670.1 hypothetical protein W97_06813 [Coniosporium apollinis CBS 100218]
MVKLHLVTGFLSLLWLTLGLASPTPDLIDPTSGKIAARNTQLQPRAIPAWEFYYNYDSAAHQSKATALTNQGYRPISLSVYGANTNPRYAAVWVQRSGPAWQATHGLTAAAYQTWFDRWRVQGYASTIVSVTGPRNNPVYAGVMEQISGVSWWQKCDMNLQQFNDAYNQAYAETKVLKSFREYGVPTDRRFCAVYHSNPQVNHWDWRPSQTPADYQATVNAFVQNQYWRPAAVSVSEDHQITSLFMDTSVGTWAARHGLTAAQLQAEYETHKANGLYIINLSGGGVGANARFTAIFAQQDVPSARAWTATGTTTGFKNNAASMATVDGIMKTFMQTNGVRQAQISIGRNGAALLQRAYTWAEPGRHITQPADAFLLASVSKAFVVAAVQSMFNSGRLTPGTKVYPRLGYTNPRDARVANITVQQLLDHTGGYDRVLSGETVFMMRQIALEQGTGGAPATMKTVVDWAFKRTLDFDPGARSQYSNYGYLLLAYLVQHVSGQSYYDYLRSTILTPNALDVRQWATAASAHRGDGIVQEARGVWLNAQTPLSNVEVPWVYGGDGMVKEAAVGPSSLSASASTVMRFVSRFGATGNGPRAVSWRDGKMNGVRTWAQARADNVDWALNLNTMEFSTGVESNELFNRLCQVDITNFLNTSPVA